MKKITRIASIFLSLALIFLAAACGKDGSGAALSYPIAAQPDCLDPQIAQGAEAKTVVLNCFEGLVRKDAEGKYSPAAAKSWSYDASTLTYTFKLREDARWVIMKKAFKPILGDNIDKTFDSRVTAADFVFALRRAVAPATGAPDSSDLSVTKNYDTVWALCFNCADAPLSNVSLRRALCTAVDYNSLTLESEDMQKTYSVIPPACSVGEGADLGSEPVSILGYGMNRSAGYWAQAQKDLTGKLSLEIICLPEHENAMRRMIQGWQKVFGLSVNFTVTALDSATLSSRVQDGDYQIALTSMSAGITDAAGFLSTLTSQGTNNIVRLSDAQFDASVKNLKALSGSELVKACRSAEGRLLSLGAVLPMFITPSYFATAKGVNGLSVDPESSAVDFVFVTAKD